MRYSFRLFIWILSVLLMPVLAFSQLRGQIVAIDNSVYVAMVDESIEDCVSVQEMENWCWAACIQMILKYNGIEYDQTDIVDSVFDGSHDWTASGNEIEKALDGWHEFTVKSFKTKTPQSFIDEITAGNPLVIGYKGHAYLLTHIFYRKNSSGTLNPFKVIMIDPAIGEEEVFDWSDFFSNLNTIISFHR